jgi:hypothetical protein
MTLMFWPVIVFMAISLAIGLYTYTQVRGSSKNYTVCNKAMPFIVIGTALMAQAVDGNATLGNVSMTWATGFWAGVMIPIGLAISLFFVGRFLAAPLNKMDLLTLPEFFYRRYDKQTEALTSALTIVCFTIVIAGNLSAVAWIFSVVSGLSYGTSLVITTAIILLYTMAGGLFAAIWTDFFQIHVALVGFVGSAGFILWKYGLGDLLAKVPAERLDLRGITSMEHGALVNWAAMISLAFGNAMALDFMERVFAANSPRTAQRARPQDAPIDLRGRKAQAAGRLQFAVRRVLQRAGEDLGGVGGRIDGEGQPGTEPRRPQHRPGGALAHDLELGEPEIDHEQLDQQRRAPHDVGERPDGPGQPGMAGHARHRQRDREQEGGRARDEEQQQADPQADPVLGQGACDQRPVDHNSLLRTPSENRRSSSFSASSDTVVMAR